MATMQHIYVVESTEQGVIGASTNARNAADRMLQEAAGSSRPQPSLREATRMLAQAGHVSIRLGPNDKKPAELVSVLRFENL